MQEQRDHALNCEIIDQGEIIKSWVWGEIDEAAWWFVSTALVKDGDEFASADWVVDELELKPKNRVNSGRFLYQFLSEICGFFSLRLLCFGTGTVLHLDAVGDL